MWKNFGKILLKNMWLVWLILFVLALLILSFRKIFSNDFWWILGLGQHFWETKEIINHDVFSYTFPNGFFWNHSRLFDIALFWLYEHGRFLSLNIFRFIIFAASYFFIYKTISLKKHYKIITLLILILSLIPLSGRLLFRPELASLFFTTLFLYLLFKDKYQASNTIWLLPILQMLWANSHAGYIYGLVIIGIFFVAELIRSLIRHRNNTILIHKDKRLAKLFFISILSFLAIFINSYGWQIIPLTYNLTLPQEALSGIVEWGHYSWKRFFHLLSATNILVLTSLIFLIYKIYKLKYKLINKLKYLAWEETLLVALYVYSTMKHGRFGLLLSLIAAIIVAKNAYQILPRKWIKNKPWPHLAILLIFIVLVNTNYTKQFGLGAEVNRYPQEAVNFVKTQKIPGNMFNEYGQGGYLIFNIYPEKQVSIDGRTPNLYTNDYFWRYNNINQGNIRQDLLEKYDVNFWLWPRNSKLQKTLWRDPDWELIYFDNLSTVHIKNTEQNQKFVDDLAYKFFSPQLDEKGISEICSENNLEKTPDLKQKLITELNKGLEINPQNWLHFKQLATVYQSCQFDQQDLLKIENYLLQAKKINPNEKTLNYKLGFTYLQLKDNQKALDYFKQASPSRSAFVGLGTAQYNLKQYKKALKTLLKARDMSGEIDEKYHQTLGRAYYQQDKNKEAIEYLHRYQDMTQDFSVESYIDLAWAYYDDGQIEKARAYNDLALEQDSEYKQALDLKKELD